MLVSPRRAPPSLQINETPCNRQTRPGPGSDLSGGRHVGGQNTSKQRGHGVIKEEASLLKIHAPKQQINSGEFSSFVGRIDSSLKRIARGCLWAGRYHPPSPTLTSQPYLTCPSSSGSAEKRPSDSQITRYLEKQASV